MNLSERLAAFTSLGQSIQTMTDAERTALANKAKQENGWFTEESVFLALEGVKVLLEPTSLNQWASSYPISETTDKTVGVAMAGNIPLVGFHDLLCVLMAGHRLRYKPSSKDSLLMDFIQNKLTSIEPRLANRISREERLNGVDALIATGSDNTSRYFDYYFRDVPHIIRKNRVSTAIIQGDEPASELASLGTDIFSYYGLGCRNVSSLLIPEGYEVRQLLDALGGFAHVMDNHKFKNNHTYQKSLLMLNQEKFLDTGFLLVKESDKLISPVSMIHYQYYKDLSHLRSLIASNQSMLQVVVSARGWFEGSLPFGTAQLPKVNDYADGVDTMKFLAGLK